MILLNKQKSVWPLISLVVVLLYASLLASIPSERLYDRENYLNYADGSVYIFATNYLRSGILGALFNEPLWLLLNMALRLFLTAGDVVKAIVFLSSGVFAYHISKKLGPRNFILIICVLVFPQVIKNYIIHLRQGAAVSLFVVGLNSKKRSTLFTVLAAFIHSSFFFLLFFQIIEKVLTRLKFSKDLKIASVIVFSAMVILGVNFIGALLSDRRTGQYNTVDVSASGVGFVFWMFIFAIFLIANVEAIKKPTGILSTFILYLSSYFFLPFSARIFESVLPSILASLASFKRRYYYMLVFLVFMFGAVQWFTSKGAFLFAK